LPLPPNFSPLDATVDEVASFRKEGRWTVFRKIREGVYESYLDNRIRKIVFASVLADRDRALAASRPSPKRRPGRPRKPRPEASQVTVDVTPLSPARPSASRAPPSLSPKTNWRS
jgi:hypothetical protein